MQFKIMQTEYIIKNPPPKNAKHIMRKNNM